MKEIALKNTKKKYFKIPRNALYISRISLSTSIFLKSVKPLKTGVIDNNPGKSFNIS